jgi:hypothetical protein
VTAYVGPTASGLARGDNDLAIAQVGKVWGRALFKEASLDCLQHEGLGLGRSSRRHAMLNVVAASRNALRVRFSKVRGKRGTDAADGRMRLPLQMLWYSELGLIGFCALALANAIKPAS